MTNLLIISFVILKIAMVLNDSPLSSKPLRHVLQRGVFGVQRITRHIWRMCVALLIAAFSFFLGQQQVFPASVRGSPLLLVPEIAVLGVMVFWLVRVRFNKTFSRAIDARARPLAQNRTPATTSVPDLTLPDSKLPHLRRYN